MSGFRGEERVELGWRLGELRRAAGLTQQQLADRLGTNWPRVSKIETGRQTPSPDDIQAWAQATGAPAEVTADLLAQRHRLDAPPLVSSQRERADLGRRLGDLRRRAPPEQAVRGLSQQRLAELLGTTQSTVSDIERGRLTPSAFLVERWAQAVGVPREVTADLLAQRHRLDAPPLVSSQRERADLGRRLGDLRRRAPPEQAVRGLSQQRLAELLGTTQSTVSRIEEGRLTPSALQVRGWARATGATKPQTAELLAQRQRIEAKYRSWRSAQRRWERSRKLAAAATTLRVFQPLLIPALLQTPEYAHRQISQWAGLYGQAGAAEAIAARLDRQAELRDTSKSFHFIVTEGALRARLGPLDMMITQLDHIASVATLPNVEVGILPLASELPIAPVFPFEIVDDLVRVETVSGERQLRNWDDITIYTTVFEQLATAALHGGKAQALLADIIADFRQLASPA